jgi:hypothetical protein
VFENDSIMTYQHSILYKVRSVRLLKISKLIIKLVIILKQVQKLRNMSNMDAKLSIVVMSKSRRKYI